MKKVYTPEEDRYIYETVKGAKEKGLRIQDVIELVANEFGKKYSTIHSRYYHLKEKFEWEESMEEQEEQDREDLGEEEEEKPVIPRIKPKVERERRQPEPQEVFKFAESMVGRFEELVTERDNYKRKYEEAKRNLDEIKGLLERGV